jgi:hypothetical protein
MITHSRVSFDMNQVRTFKSINNLYPELDKIQESDITINNSCGVKTA